MQLWLKKIGIKEIYVRWIGIPLLALVITLAKPEDDDPWLIEFGYSLLFTAIFWNGCYLIIKHFRTKYPELSSTAKRLIYTIMSIMVLLIFFSPVMCWAMNIHTLDEFSNPAVFFEYTNINVIASFIVGSLYENVYFFEKWKISIQQNEALKNQQVRTQFEVLQNQMSPHFLFNSLNTLTTLIAEDATVAVQFTEKLSEVYRYILQNKEREIVKLGDELEFVRNYVYLLQIRYPENLSVDFKVADELENCHIAPLTIQILVENAIKHNVVSKMNPLYINIYVENGKSIVVKNNLQKKKVIEKSTKTGLDNIKKRYAYLGNYKIDIINTANNFMVAVPLIKVWKESEELIEA